MSIYQGDQKVANNITIENASYSVPIGTIISYASTTLPVGFLLCDGSEVSKTDYADLYVVVGNKFGTATDTTKFKLPDLRDKFIQGANDNLGTSKDAGLPNITGSFTSYDYVYGNAKDSFTRAISNKDSGSNIVDPTDAPYVMYNFDASKSNAIYGNSDTVQPPSVCLHFVIKAEKISDQYADAVGALIDDTSVSANKVWSSQKINEECIKVHKKNTSVTTAVYQWFTARYDPQTKQISITIPITIADDVSNVSLDFGDKKILLHTGSGEVEQTPTQVSAIGIEDSKSLGLLRFDMTVDSGDTSINCIAIPDGTTITFS